MTAAVIIRTRSRCPRGAARRRLRMSRASRRWASVQAMGIRDGDTRIQVGVLFLSGSHAAPSRRRHSRRRRCWSADLLLLLHDVSRSCLKCRYHSENNPLRKQPVTRHGVEWPLPDWPDPCDTTWFSLSTSFSPAPRYMVYLLQRRALFLGRGKLPSRTIYPALLGTPKSSLISLS